MREQTRARKDGVNATKNAAQPVNDTHKGSANTSFITSYLASKQAVAERKEMKSKRQTTVLLSEDTQLEVFLSKGRQLEVSFSEDRQLEALDKTRSTTLQTVQAQLLEEIFRSTPPTSSHPTFHNRNKRRRRTKTEKENEKLWARNSALRIPCRHAIEKYLELILDLITFQFWTSFSTCGAECFYDPST